MNILAIIQARMGSSRLPGKVLLDIAGKPMLQRVVERARRARTLNGVVVATTQEASDDPVAEFCAAQGYPLWRGSLHDVLDRYYGAAEHFGAQVVVRLTADCPLLDPGLVDEAVQAFFGVRSPEEFDLAAAPYDFVANRLPPPWRRTYPIGLDVEVASFAALQRAWREGAEKHHREHVMPFLYEGEQPRVRIHILDNEVDYGDLRWTVDTPEDLEAVRRVYAYFGGREDFTWQDVLALYAQHPELSQLNAGIHHKAFNEIDERSAGGG